jgi:hypothetical protein
VNRMMNRIGTGSIIALPFFVLWLTQDNITYFIIGIALALGLGTSDKSCKKKRI